MRLLGITIALLLAILAPPHATAAAVRLMCSPEYAEVGWLPKPFAHRDYEIVFDAESSTVSVDGGHPIRAKITSTLIYWLIKDSSNWYAWHIDRISGGWSLSSSVYERSTGDYVTKMVTGNCRIANERQF